MFAAFIYHSIIDWFYLSAYYTLQCHQDPIRLEAKKHSSSLFLIKSAIHFG